MLTWSPWVQVVFWNKPLCDIFFILLNNNDPRHFHECHRCNMNVAHAVRWKSRSCASKPWDVVWSATQDLPSHQSSAWRQPHSLPKSGVALGGEKMCDEAEGMLEHESKLSYAHSAVYTLVLWGLYCQESQYSYRYPWESVTTDLLGPSQLISYST